MRKFRLLSASALVSVLALTGCGTADTPSTPTPGGSGGALSPVKLQLQWFYQAQFAGYIAAVDQARASLDDVFIRYTGDRPQAEAPMVGAVSTAVAAKTIVT